MQTELVMKVMKVGFRNLGDARAEVLIEASEQTEGESQNVFPSMRWVSALGAPRLRCNAEVRHWALLRKHSGRAVTPTCVSWGCDLFSECCLDLNIAHCLTCVFYFCLGQAGQSPAKVADEMLDAIVEFASKRTVQHLKEIKIVIFQTSMLKDFYESMKKREDSNSSTPESLISLLKCK